MESSAFETPVMTQSNNTEQQTVLYFLNAGIKLTSYKWVPSGETCLVRGE
jgi:hypothetical protein